MADGTLSDMALDDFTGVFQSVLLRDALKGVEGADADLSETDLSQLLGGLK